MGLYDLFNCCRKELDFIVHEIFSDHVFYLGIKKEKREGLSNEGSKRQQDFSPNIKEHNLNEMQCDLIT